MKLNFITSGSATVLIVTIFNRGTGYLRDLTMTAALGASPASQIFVFAFRVFGLVRALTSEAAIPAIVVDRYVRQRLGAEIADGPAFLKAEWGSWWLLWAFWAVLLGVANPFLMASMLPYDIYARLSSGFILVFSLLLGIGLSTTSVSAVYPSLFQAQDRFFAHSALASLQNIVFIGIFAIVLLLKIDELQLLSLQVAVALVIAGSLQIMISCLMISHPFAAVIWPFRFPRPRRFHLRLAFDTLTKMVPISLFNVTSPLAAILATLILVRDDLNITYFFVAERLVQLVPGTIGYAVGIVILPLTARARHNKSSDLFQTFILISTLLVTGGVIAVYCINSQGRLSIYYINILISPKLMHLLHRSMSAASPFLFCH
jgi:peptidoglycan biosynthesis protein MviN/MurJ (putative lipid II flippase)